MDRETNRWLLRDFPGQCQPPEADQGSHPIAPNRPGADQAARERDGSLESHLMKAKCESCDRIRQFGNSIRWRRVYKDRGKRIKMLLCDQCFDTIETRKRPA